MTQHLCDSEFPWCPADARNGDFYKLRVKDLSPTQFAVGKAEVTVRAGRMRKKYKKDPAKLHDYLRTRPIPILVRGNKFYLVDHHHLASGLYLGLNETLVCTFVNDDDAPSLTLVKEVVNDDGGETRCALLRRARERALVGLDEHLVVVRFSEVVGK